MDIRSTLYSFILILIFCGGYALAEDTTGNGTINSADTIADAAVNQSSQETGSQEALLNLALDARKYALENGKFAGISAFSDQSSFVRNGMYISAYDRKGVLLSDPYQGDKIGTPFIADDHDAGIVRQLRDLAQSGGGIMTPDVSGNKISYYALDVDAGWWIVAASGRVSSNS